MPRRIPRLAVDVWLRDARDCVYRLGDRVQGPGMLRHDFRRTAARNLERGGVPRSVAMKITGHRTEAVYRRYAITSDDDQRDAAARLGTFLGTP